MESLTNILERALHFALIYVALAALCIALPRFSADRQDAAVDQATYHDLANVERRLRTDAAELTREFDEATSGLEAESVEALDGRIADTRTAIGRENAALGSGADVLDLVTRGPDALFEDQRHRLRVAMLGRQLEALSVARRFIEHRDAEARERAARAALAAAEGACADAEARLRALDEDLTYRLRSLVESEEHRTLAAEVTARCGERDAARREVTASDVEDGASEALRATFLTTRASLNESFEATLGTLMRAKDGAYEAWQESFVAQADETMERWGVREGLLEALGLLALMVATPFLIRMFFWLVLARMAEQSPATRLVAPHAGSTALAHTDRSATSLEVRLDAGHELLVRQSYLQSCSLQGSKATQWFLDWRRPFASWASGLTFLTRVRGEGEVTTVSAEADPFAEVSMLTLPEGATLVLHPRALVGVVQPIGQPLRISSHWRFGSLRAWLTLQFRFLVFHGPCHLVVKGGRGVRIEPAAHGRVFAHSQLVGYSADLAYSVTRHPTFWPYFLGNARLLQGCVAPGEGVVVIEEAPSSAAPGGGVRQRLEGAFDVFLAALGI